VGEVESCSSCCSSQSVGAEEATGKHRKPLASQKEKRCAIAGGAGDSRISQRGMCTYLMQMMVVTTRKAGPIGGGCGFSGECCAGGGVSRSLWRATKILEIRRRGRRNENRS
jgi:hypothetical protein